MPAVLDSRSHSKLSFNRDGNGSSGAEVLSASHPQNSKIKVEGTSFIPNNGVYAVGVIDTNTKELHVFEAATFSVQALVGESLRKRVNEDEGILGGSAYLEKKKDLINTYAPVKKQRQLRAAINAVVSDEKIEGFDESMESMKQTLAEAAQAAEEKAKLSDQQITGIIGQMRDLLPPFDLQATTASEIYDFSTLFPESLVSCLDPNDTNSTCHALLKWIHEDFKPVSPSTTAEEDQFVEMKRLISLGQLGRLYFASKQDKRKTFAKLLNILISMVFLYKIRRKKNWEAYDVYANDALAKRLGELYSPDKRIGGAIDREGAHKLLAHICIFVLRLTPFWEFDFSDLKTDLNVQAKELIAMLVFCGISVKQSAGKSGMLGTLKAPLVIQTGGNQRKGKGAGPKRK
jgi:hypothetical protein